jgi:polyferredoxin
VLVSSNPQPTESASPKSSSETRSDRSVQRRNRLVRIWVLTLGLIIITIIGFGHQLGWAKVVGVDALCPFGGIETLWTLIISATFLQRVAASSVVLLAIVTLIAVIFRRSFCGYICPFGALQELFARAGSLIWRKRRPQMPAVLDRPARYLKYIVLVVFAVWSWQAATLVLRPYDPWVAWMHLSSADLPAAIAEFSIGFVVLGIALAGSFVYDRFFCKYLCPMGAFLAIISPLSVFKVRRNADTCIDCKACDKACPVNVTVSRVEIVKSPECIDCSECVNVCPVKDTLEVAGPKKKSGKRVVLGTMAVLGSVLAIIAIGLAITTATGTFAWTLPKLATAAPGTVVTTASFDVETIKGSTTFDEASKATGIPASAWIAKFGITQAEMGKKIGETVKAKGFDVETDVRDWVKQQLEANEGKSGSDAPAPATAATATAPVTPPAATTPQTGSSSSSFDVSTIVGSMTFDEASKATGIPASAWIAKFGITKGQMSQKMGPTVKAKGLDVETDVRAFVAKELGQTTAP